QYATSSDSAQQNCVHTNIAHQTSGPGLVPKHSFTINAQSLTQLNLLSASYALGVQNTGDSAITSISGSVNCVSLPLTFNAALPLQSGGSSSGTSLISLQSVVLILGVTYPTAVTVTFDDGTSVTQTSSVVYMSS